LYAGAIHSRLNVDLVRQIVERFRDGSMIVVGPIADQNTAEALSQIPGLVLRDPVSREAITGLTASVDACVLPHHRTALTESMSPLKLYESVAAGRPSAVSDLPPVHGVHSSIRIVRDGESFPDAVAAAIASGPIPEPERRAFVLANSWAERHGRILDFAYAPGN
jgi:hypothetical protein